MSDTKVYEPYIRDLLGTPSQYREAVVLKSRIVPSGTALCLRYVSVSHTYLMHVAGVLGATPTPRRGGRPCVLIERLRENLADSTRQLFKKLYQDRLDGPVACHVLAQISR